MNHVQKRLVEFYKNYLSFERRYQEELFAYHNQGIDGLPNFTTERELVLEKTHDQRLEIQKRYDRYLLLALCEVTGSQKRGIKSIPKWQMHMVLSLIDKFQTLFEEIGISRDDFIELTSNVPTKSISVEEYYSTSWERYLKSMRGLSKHTSQLYSALTVLNFFDARMREGKLLSDGERDFSLLDDLAYDYSVFYVPFQVIKESTIDHKDTFSHMDSVVLLSMLTEDFYVGFQHQLTYVITDKNTESFLYVLKRRMGPLYGYLEYLGEEDRMKRIQEIIQSFLTLKLSREIKKMKDFESWKNTKNSKEDCSPFERSFLLKEALF